MQKSFFAVLLFFVSRFYFSCLLRLFAGQVCRRRRIAERGGPAEQFLQEQGTCKSHPEERPDQGDAPGKDRYPETVRKYDRKRKREKKEGINRFRSRE